MQRGFDAPGVRATAAIVLSAFLGCALYAAYDSRGLYLDGFYFLYRIAERAWFFLPAPPRATVDVLREAPTVLLARYTDLSMARLGQVFSFSMAALPAFLIVPCWFIAPRGQKAWIVLPLAYLLIGAVPAAFQPHCEASNVGAYVWVLFFLLLFRTRTSASQALFIALCIPAFLLAEAACLLMPVLLLACAVRLRSAESSRERWFLGVSAALIVSIALYQLSWVIAPRVPEDVGMLMEGLRNFQFLGSAGQVNLAFVNAAVGSVALAAIFVTLVVRPQASALARAIAVSFGVFALASVVVAFTVERSFAPYSHYHARYLPILVGGALGLMALWITVFAPQARAVLQRPEILSAVLLLCIAQAAADVASTWRWREYVTDLQARLEASSGLVPFESTVRTGDRRRDLNWTLLDHGWLMPMVSVVWSKNGVVKSMIDYPAGSTWRPLDPQKPAELPKLPGVDFRPYLEAFAAQRAGGPVRE